MKRSKNPIIILFLVWLIVAIAVVGWRVLIQTWEFLLAVATTFIGSVGLSFSKIKEVDKKKTKENKSMSSRFDRQKFLNLSEAIKQEFNLEFSTLEELEEFRKENPAKYNRLTNKIEKALHDSVVGGNFESLSEEEMMSLQGAGDVNVETTPICVTVGISFGIVISKAKKC
ncbi:type 2 lantibiotic, SP_1948 family [Pilibacter termitis]|uniref:Type 2 lantibiotic, SP_1948 family n=1 Tax=Pilibacter termitis TaxID=263852 RepID=A0A1T4KG74_9ENTE|nr:lichenicidin A2 family type 2 lantibiotic [Pilibacter termitis]SJZ41357.1 type 2 lantibiotic, SP_1948 family [Pilibacter termitis]